MTCDASDATPRGQYGWRLGLRGESDRIDCWLATPSDVVPDTEARLVLVARALDQTSYTLNVAAAVHVPGSQPIDLDFSTGRVPFDPIVREYDFSISSDRLLPAESRMVTAGIVAPSQGEGVELIGVYVEYTAER